MCLISARMAVFIPVFLRLELSHTSHLAANDTGNCLGLCINPVEPSTPVLGGMRLQSAFGDLRKSDYCSSAVVSVVLHGELLGVDGERLWQVVDYTIDYQNHDVCKFLLNGPIWKS